MDDARTMRMVQGIGDLDRDAKSLTDRERTPAQALGQRLPFQVLHDDEVDAIVFADVVEGADVRVAQPRRRFRFALEALTASRAVEHMLRQDLDCDRAAQSRVLGAIDLAHSARSKQGLNLVRSKACSGRERHGSGADYMGNGTEDWDDLLPSLRFGWCSGLMRPKGAP